jgi:hypothetical protein
LPLASSGSRNPSPVFCGALRPKPVRAPKEPADSLVRSVRPCPLQADIDLVDLPVHLGTGSFSEEPNWAGYRDRGTAVRMATCLRPTRSAATGVVSQAVQRRQPVGGAPSCTGTAPLACHLIAVWVSARPSRYITLRYTYRA